MNSDVDKVDAVIDLPKKYGKIKLVKNWVWISKVYVNFLSQSTLPLKTSSEIEQNKFILLMPSIQSGFVQGLHKLKWALGWKVNRGLKPFMSG